MRRASFLASTLTIAALIAIPAGAAEIPPERLLAGVYPESTGLPADPFDPATVEAIAAWGGATRPSFTGLFHSIDETTLNTSLDHVTISMLTAAWAAGTTPFSNVDYLDTAQSIVDGRKSSDGSPNLVELRIRHWARQVKAWLDGANPPGFTAPAAGRSLVIAPFPEMNGTWTSYGCYRAGTRTVTEAAAFRTAFRRFVQLVEEELGPQVDRVRWSWAPNGVSSPACGPAADYYPGDDVVDVIGVSAFNFSGVNRSPWEDVSAVFHPLDHLRAEVSNAKPYLVAQTGSPSAGGDKNGWIAAMFPYLANDPNVVGFVWFNIDKFEGSPPVWVDWKCCPDDRYPAWQAGMALPTTRYQWPLDDWFAPGSLPFTPRNIVPVAANDSFTLDEGATAILAVTKNDTDGNFDPLTPSIVTPPQHGTATPNPDGTITYRHDASETAADAFTYVVSDGKALSNTATVSLTIRLRPDHMVGLVDPSQGRWHLRHQDGTVSSFFFGNPGDVPFLGDWDCDGDETPGLYRRSDGFVYLRNSNDDGVADIRFFFGNPGDLPLAGDFDGDGCDTVSVYRPSESRVFIINKLGSADQGLGAAAFSYVFGDPGDKPFVGDFDGDGRDSIGLHRESTGLVYFRNRQSTGVADSSFIYGDPADRLVAGDWRGDSGDTVGIFRPGTAAFFLKHTNAPGFADEVIPLGAGTWLPVAGVIDG